MNSIMKRTISLILLLCILLGCSPNKQKLKPVEQLKYTTKNVKPAGQLKYTAKNVKLVGQLKIYTAKSRMTCPLRESYNRGAKMEFKKGQIITDSQACFYTISNYDNTHFLFGGQCDSDGESCLIAKANVKIDTYEIGELPVSAIGDGVSFTSKNGTSYRLFIAHANGYKFYSPDLESDSYFYDSKITNARQRFCVLLVTTKYEYSNQSTEEYIIDIVDDKVQLYEDGKSILLENDWVNYNEFTEEYYDISSFDQNGNLATNMYYTRNKPNFLESVCYIPSMNALYIGKGVFIPLAK